VKTVLLTVGRVQAALIDADVHYRKLIGRYLPLTVVEARDEADLLRKLPVDGRLVALDRGGKALDSLGWSRWLDERRLEARDVWLLIGGPAGLPSEALAAAHPYD
jgi:23S rRNA (pseudouridine1915-N3)-methyltransferase